MSLGLAAGGGGFKRNLSLLDVIGFFSLVITSDTKI